jgi:[calcium/calmodulin-dependent protein kinase] kinase
MEYAENGALKTENPLTMEKCKRYFSQLITGLAYRKSLQLSNHLVHTRGICHRDIKPENLLLTSLDTIKISDFGVSYEFKDDDTLKSTAGTPAFQSPESCTERPYSGKAADIWAAGITLYILVYGYPPFGGDSYHEIYQSILNKQLEFPNIPDSLRDLFSRILDKNPETRIKLEQIQQHKWVV